MNLESLPKTVNDLKVTPVPQHLFLPKGMIVPEEQILLYLLARDVYTGKGKIIDAGAFCGASAYSFAAGLEDSNKTGRCIHSYDLFVVDDSYTKSYIQNNFFYFTDLSGDRRFLKAEIATGDSFVDIFKFQTQRYSSFIDLHIGSIADFEWPSLVIEILFIDVAKTLELQSHIFKTFFKYLMTGNGVLIQQDFHHAYHPYIHVAMEYLADYFEITHSKIGASRVYRLIRSVPDFMVQRIVDYDFSNDEIYNLMTQCIQNSPEDERALLKILLANHLMLINDKRLSDVINEFVNSYSQHPNFDWYLGEIKSAIGTPAINQLKLLGYIF
jgi:hypothetical protein